MQTRCAGSQTWRVGFPAAGGMGGPPVTRYQYAGGHGYEDGLISLQGVNPALPPVTLQHVGERWYDPALGRFVQRDPIGIAGGKNVYAYCANTPIGSADPSGLRNEIEDDVDRAINRYRNDPARRQNHLERSLLRDLLRLIPTGLDVGWGTDNGGAGLTMTEDSVYLHVCVSVSVPPMTAWAGGRAGYGPDGWFVEPDSGVEVGASPVSVDIPSGDVTFGPRLPIGPINIGPVWD